MFDYRGATALVTGASSGIGETMALALAQRGSNLVLVARTEAKLEALALRLRAEHRVEAHVIVADLADPAAPSQIWQAVRDRGLRVDLLVNNAGFGLKGPFLTHDLSREMAQIAVNVTSLVALTHLFAPDMVARRRGGIINLSSSAAFQALPGMAVYGASKSFVLQFSEALWRELAGADVHVLAVCPGPVATEFFDRIGSSLKASAMDAPDSIVAEILKAFDRKRPLIVPGRLWVRMGTLATRFMPRALVVRMAEGVTRNLMK